MAANINDKFTEATNGSRPVATTLTALLPSGASPGTATCGALTGWPTATAVHFIIYTVDVNGNKVSGSQTDWKGIVSGSTITGLVLKAGTNNGYSIGAVVQAAPTAAWADDVTEGLAVEHNQDGTHSNITATTVTADEFIVTGSASANNGWEVGLPTPDTVIYNGNRSYDLVFNGTDLTDTISPGMRLRTTRTVTAPTNCFSLDGTNDYYNDTSVAGMTFTDDFAAGAWVYLTAYGAVSVINSRYNGTSGWSLQISADGRVTLVGFNAGAANSSDITSYQSIPLNRWVHVAAQLDMSAFTNTSTTSYVMIDGVNVPAVVSRAGTNPTALVQAGNLEVGSRNAGTFPFPGYIDQPFVTSAKLTQDQVRAIYSRGITASDVATYNIVSAYSNGSTTDINTTNANNLTAQNGATTATRSPFATNSFGTATGTTDYAIVTKSAFSTNTTLTVQVPEGCTIPTSGGVSAVAYSTQKAPYGMSIQQGRWEIVVIGNTFTLKGSPVAGTWYNEVGYLSITIPVGEWGVEWRAAFGGYKTAAATIDAYGTLSTANNTESDPAMTAWINQEGYSGTQGIRHTTGREESISASSATPYYLNFKTSIGSVSSIAIYGSSSYTMNTIKARNAYL